MKVSLINRDWIKKSRDEGVLHAIAALIIAVFAMYLISDLGIRRMISGSIIILVISFFTILFLDIALSKFYINKSRKKIKGS